MTVDSMKVIKIWNIVKMSLLSEVKIENIKGVNSVAVSCLHQRVFLGRQNIRILDFCNKQSGSLSEDNMINACNVNYSAMEIYLASENNLKVWGLVSGVLLR